MNGDGIRDIVSGSFPGEIYVMPGREDGTFAAPVTLKDSNGKEINLGTASVVAIEDWDRDGDLDMTIGTHNGEVYFMASDNGRFGEAVKLTANGEAIMAGLGGPEIADWDGNGTLDLLLGDGGGRVRFFPNSAKTGLPELGEAVVLVSKSANAPGVPGLRSKIDVADWNGDGKPDLLLGDFSIYTDGPRVPPPEPTEAEIKLKADTIAAIKPIKEKTSKLYDEITEVCLKQMGLSDMKAFKGNKELYNKFRKLQVQHVADNKEIQILQAEKAPLLQTLTNLSIANASGKVWVFLRKR